MRRIAEFSEIAEIIEKWPSVKDFADDVGIAYTTAHSWRTRGLRDASRYPSIVRAAKRRGLRGVTLERLVSIAERECDEPRDAA